jgi:iron(III) transport system permease protein
MTAFERSGPSLLAYLAVAALTLVLLGLIVFPIGLLLYGTVSAAPPQELVLSLSNFTLRNFREIASSDVAAVAALNSFIVAAGGAVIAMVIAVFLVWSVGRTNVPLKGLIGMAAIMPLFVSELVAGIAWSRLGFSFSGIINLGLRDLGLPWVINIGTLSGISFVLGLYYAPYAYLLMVAAFRNLDPSLEEVAAICGAGTLYTLWRVVLPLMSYAIYSAALMVFVTLLSSYGIPFILGGASQITFLTTFIYRLLSDVPTDYQLATTLGVGIALLTLFGVLLQSRLFANRSLTTIGGKSYQPRMIDIGRWKYLVLGLAILYLLVAVVIPYMVMFLIAFQSVQFFPTFLSVFNPATMTLGNIDNVLEDPESLLSVWNSIKVGLLLCLFGAVLCVTLGYVLERTKLAGRGMLQAISSIPVAIPGLIIGVAFLWAWIMTPLYGTIWILVFALLARHLPDGLRPVSATLRQIHPELEEAAAICGAGWSRIFLRIVVPLARSGVFSLIILLFIYAVRELGPILFLTNTGTRTMSVEVLQNWDNGDIPGAVVIALFQSMVLLAALLIGRFVFRVRVTP